jgi:hypothetical protein
MSDRERLWRERRDITLARSSLLEWTDLDRQWANDCCIFIHCKRSCTKLKTLMSDRERSGRETLLSNSFQSTRMLEWTDRGWEMTTYIHSVIWIPWWILSRTHHSKPSRYPIYSWRDDCQSRIMHCQGCTIHRDYNARAAAPWRTKFSVGNYMAARREGDATGAIMPPNPLTIWKKNFCTLPS